MKQNKPVTFLHLAPDDVIDIADGKGVSIEALSGAIWITQSHDGRDIVLERGDAFTLDRRGIAVLSALRPATVSVMAASSQPVRIVRRLVPSLASAA